MQIKEAWKVLFSKSASSFSAAYPNLGAALPLVFGKEFKYNLSGYSAYNNKIFYSASNLLVTKLTETPIMFSKREANTEKSIDRFYSKAIANEKRQFIKAQALTEVENHPLNDLFDDPNDYASGIELMEDFWHNFNFGDGYLFFELNEIGRNTGKPVHVHSLCRDRMEPVKSNDRFNAIAYYNYTCLNGVVIPIQPNVVLHLKQWNPVPLQLKGLGVDQIVSKDVSLSESNMLAQGAAFANGGRGTLFSSDADMTTEGRMVDKMTAQQAASLKETILKDFAGAQNNRRLHFTNGKVEVQSYGDTLAEMELVAAGTSNWEHIYATMGIPDVLCPTTKASTESNVKAGYKALVTNNIISKLRKFDQKLLKITKQWYPDIVPCHDLTEFSELAPDLELMAKVYGQPLLTNNERRAIFNYDELDEGGDVILIPSGFMKLEDIMDADLDSVPNPNSANAVTRL